MPVPTYIEGRVASLADVSGSITIDQILTNHRVHDNSFFNSKNIDHNNIAEMYEEEVLAWAILNEPNYRENYGTEMWNM